MSKTKPNLKLSILLGGKVSNGDFELVVNLGLISKQSHFEVKTGDSKRLTYYL